MTDAGHGAGSSDEPKKYTSEELDNMSRDELFELGTNMDGVDVAYRRHRWSVEGTKAEKRAERAVAFWFALAGVSGLAFGAIYIFWPWKYKGYGEDGYQLYTLATPLYGLTLGLAVTALGVGAVLYTKKFIPEEVSIQDRHDGGSSELDKKTAVAVLGDSLETSTIGRRKLIIGSGLFGVGAVGLTAVLPFLGGMIKNPWAKGDKSDLWVSGWTPDYPGQTIYLRRDTGRPHDIVLVRPEDLDAGSMETVFPFKEAHRNDEHALFKELRGIRNSVMLIRLRTADAEKAIKRKGQESFNYGDYFAYSKICTHLGCPTSLYEQQTNRILCPCHQSQFLATEFGKPIFGPAARALPQLPITVIKEMGPDGKEEEFLVADGDFIEALGPAFWERPTT
ncbi:MULTISPECIES: ubiquinol-cytochrome c reductase iron-sulfur subunit [Antrihabitans]|uniref:Cytochrome bc1 complex Rieske iron-sulfur subunit n=2 Tax=Antrihabitans TaxID=2799491 RepID=A0A934NUZ5_9NOCA|nr:ubiquinol-cytochrome c reductase iron-sulfur subunit [Antrihabitans stalagmiti]MBJ8341770.1 ubiquinol-cytochrome c reductase iron-sulfur subunit [Antrihabitans stalagmiti]